MVAAIDWAGFMLFAAVWTVTVVSPGPDFAATIHTAMNQGRHAGLLVVVGIAIGTAIWATASLAGLAPIFERAGWLYHLLRLAGAAYLIYLGLRMIVCPATTANLRPRPTTRAATAYWKSIRLGVFTDLANPKAAAFFTSLFAVTVPPPRQYGST